MTYSIINKTKWGVCSICGGKEQDVIKVKKDLFCLPCRNNQKAIEQLDRQKKREYAKRTGFKLRNGLAESKGTEEYGMAERQSLINDLDYTHSRLVRMIAADAKTGLANCFCCGKLEHWTIQQLSHFVKRKNTLTRWDLRANRNSCRHCNENLDGNLKVFAQKLNQEQGGLAEQLQEISREVHKWTTTEIKEMLIDQRAKLRAVELKFK